MFLKLVEISRGLMHIGKSASHVRDVGKNFPRLSKNSKRDWFRAQVECVLAQQLRRAQQMFFLYSRLWNERAFRMLICRMKRRLSKRGQLFLMTAATTSAFNWEQERIHDVELTRRFKEIDNCHKLKEASVNARFVECQSCDSNEETECWEPFIRKDDLVLWKKEASGKPGSGLYCYKMYGKYLDVTATDFLIAFLDTAKRKSWDGHVVDLRVIESEPATNSDVIYWETKWPTLFNNRDYIFKRRFGIYQKEKLMIVCNKGTSHAAYPVHPNKTRVTEYWSYMVIKPLSGDFNKPGIEFSLTYFDNPGASLPSAISLWVSSTGMPEYLSKLRLEAIKIATAKADLPDIHELVKIEVLAGVTEENLNEKVTDLQTISNSNYKSEDKDVQNSFENGNSLKDINTTNLNDEKCEDSNLSKYFPWLTSSRVDDAVIFQMLIT